LVITNTPKKHPEEAERRLDPIESSMRSHKMKGIVKLLIQLIQRLIIFPISLNFSLINSD
jgi:hypothetical protein